MDAVRALVAVSVLATGATTVQESASDKASDKSDYEHGNKGPHKKEKLYFYRCGEPGHFAVGCNVELCDL